MMCRALNFLTGGPNLGASHASRPGSNRYAAETSDLCQDYLLLLLLRKLNGRQLYILVLNMR